MVKTIMKSVEREFKNLNIEESWKELRNIENVDGRGIVYEIAQDYVNQKFFKEAMKPKYFKGGLK